MKPGPILTTLSPASKARSSGAQKIPLRELENSEDWRDEAGGNDARRVPMPSVFARSALADGQALWSGGVPNRRRSRLPVQLDVVPAAFLQRSLGVQPGRGPADRRGVAPRTQGMQNDHSGVVPYLLRPGGHPLRARRFWLA